MMESACDKSMIGELTLQALELLWQRKFGLGTRRLPVAEGKSFKFGYSEVVDVREREILPLGNLGSPGVIDLSVVLGADTPLLVKKDDLGALGVLVDFGWHKVACSALNPEVAVPP